MTGNVFAEGTVVSGRFRVETLLGAGGYGEVYRAEQLSMGRKVALKVLRAHLADKAGALERFRNEAKFACQLRHPNTVVYHDFGDDPELGVFWLAMEYLEGWSLEQRLRSEGVLTLEDCADILDGVAGSLHEAHGLGLVHRDIKPANIMLVTRGGNPNYVKVIDFGIAKSVALESDGLHSLTETGTVLGSPAYMAPEQIRREHAPMGPHTDVYALAIMLYRLLSGVLPFRGATPIEVAMAHLTAEAPRLGSLGDVGAPPAVERLLLEALSKEPSGRPRSAEALATRFRAAIAMPLPLGTTPTALLTDEEVTEDVPPPARPRWTVRHKTQMLLAVTIILLGTAIIVGLGAVGIKELIRAPDDPVAATPDAGVLEVAAVPEVPPDVGLEHDEPAEDASPAAPTDVALIEVAAPEPTIPGRTRTGKRTGVAGKLEKRTTVDDGDAADAPGKEPAVKAVSPGDLLDVSIAAKPWGTVVLGGKSANGRLHARLAPGTHTVVTHQRGEFHRTHKITVSATKRNSFVLPAGPH